MSSLLPCLVLASSQHPQPTQNTHNHNHSNKQQHTQWEQGLASAAGLLPTSVLSVGHGGGKQQ